MLLEDGRLLSGHYSKMLRSRKKIQRKYYPISKFHSHKFHTVNLKPLDQMQTNKCGTTTTGVTNNNKLQEEYELQEIIAECLWEILISFKMRRA